LKFLKAFGQRHSENAFGKGSQTMHSAEVFGKGSRAIHLVEAFRKRLSKNAFD